MSSGTFITTSSNVIKISENQKVKWTMIYYMCGDSNMDVYIDPLIQKLSELGSDPHLNIVCLVDKKGYGNSKIVYINETGKQIELNEDLGWPSEVQMNNLNTFKLFCTQMMKYFPAEHYCLIIYASGGHGWQGYSLPDKYGKKTFLYQNLQHP